MDIAAILTLLPTVIATLNAIQAKLTTEALLQMNYATGVQHADSATVAKGFLTQTGLI